MIVTSSPQVLQSSVATDSNVSIDSDKTRPSLASSRLQYDITCDSEDTVPHPSSHEDHPLLSDKQNTANSVDILKSEVTIDKVPLDDGMKVFDICYRSQRQKSGWQSWVWLLVLIIVMSNNHHVY